MARTTVTSSDELAEHLHDADWAIVDCRFSLSLPERGRRDYEAAHIPSAVYAHLDRDLSAPVVPGTTGRHPLPAIDVLARTLSRWVSTGASRSLPTTTWAVQSLRGYGGCSGGWDTGPSPCSMEGGRTGVTSVGRSAMVSNRVLLAGSFRAHRRGCW